MCEYECEHEKHNIKSVSNIGKDPWLEEDLQLRSKIIKLFEWESFNNNELTVKINHIRKLMDANPNMDHKEYKKLIEDAFKLLPNKIDL